LEYVTVGSLALLAGVGLHELFGWGPIRSAPWPCSRSSSGRLETLGEAREHDDDHEDSH
jgi:hypothetical protein